MVDIDMDGYRERLEPEVNKGQQRQLRQVHTNKCLASYSEKGDGNETVDHYQTSAN